MKILTYHDLFIILGDLSFNELAMPVVVQDVFTNDCCPVEFRKAPPDHSCLEEGHPVLVTK